MVLSTTVDNSMVCIVFDRVDNCFRIFPMILQTKGQNFKHKVNIAWQKHGGWDGLGGHEGNTPKEKGAKIIKYQMPIEAIYSA